MSRNRRQLLGFTLIELMLALAMTAMLALTLYQTMAIAMRAQRSATAAVRPIRAATVAMDMISHDLESATPPNGVLSGAFIGLHQTGVSGDQDSVEFYCIGRDDDPEPGPLTEGVRRVDLILKTDENPPVLVRAVTRNLLANQEEDPQQEVLCRGVRAFSLRYWDGTVWQEEWDSTTVGDVLPMAIEITLDLDEGSDPANTGSTGRINQIKRIIPLACAKLPADTTGTSGSDMGGLP